MILSKLVPIAFLALCFVMPAAADTTKAPHVPLQKTIGQSVLGANGTDVSDAVVTLRSPKIEGDNLTFDVAVLEGSLDGANGAAALFIDHFGSSFSVDSVNGGDPFGDYYVDPRLGGAWYQPSDNFGKLSLPKCGYYPDPPCY